MSDSRLETKAANKLTNNGECNVEIDFDVLLVLVDQKVMDLFSMTPPRMVPQKNSRHDSLTIAHKSWIKIYKTVE